MCARTRKGRKTRYEARWHELGVLLSSELLPPRETTSQRLHHVTRVLLSSSSVFFINAFEPKPSF